MIQRFRQDTVRRSLRRGGSLHVFGLLLLCPVLYRIDGIPQVSENGGLPSFNIGNISFSSAQSLPSDKASDTLQVSDNLTIDAGSNQLRIGFEYLNIAFPELTPVASRSTFGYSGIYTSIVSSVDAETAPAQFLIAPEAEAFNLTNTPNFSHPGVGNFGNPATFGQITSTKDIPRQIQLALKSYF